MLTKHTIEHEFLFRWDERGAPQGCHIAYRESVREDSVEISSRLLDPRPVDLSDADKLAEIGAAINAAALAALQERTEALATMTAERDALQEQVDASPAINGVPQVVSRFQGLAAMHMQGDLGAVEALMQHPDTPSLVKLAWNNVQEFRRQSPMVAEIAAILQWSAQKVDALFVLADSIKP